MATIPSSLLHSVRLCPATALSTRTTELSTTADLPVVVVVLFVFFFVVVAADVVVAIIIFCRRRRRRRRRRFVGWGVENDAMPGRSYCLFGPHHPIIIM